jgi:hypothetical protein
MLNNSIRWLKLLLASPRLNPSRYRSAVAVRHVGEESRDVAGRRGLGQALNRRDSLRRHVADGWPRDIDGSITRCEYLRVKPPLEAFRTLPKLLRLF